MPPIFATPGDPVPVYVPTERFDKTITADEPWVMSVPISDITPRFYRPEG